MYVKGYPLKFHTKYFTHTLKDFYDFITLKFEELLDLRALTRFFSTIEIWHFLRDMYTYTNWNID